MQRHYVPSWKEKKRKEKREEERLLVAVDCTRMQRGSEKERQQQQQKVSIHPSIHPEDMLQTYVLVLVLVVS